ncbi:MAG TPA: Ig-like domain-containing protein [Candidatus Angelobacter sp.]|nr:Ig-like domain-containing protein [Candidatus Angelobacter sp.]
MKLKIEKHDLKWFLLSVILAGPFDLSATTNTVNFGSFFFTPNNLTINVGDTVVWQGNTPFASHTITGTGADPICGSGTVVSCSHTFNVPGSYPYECILLGHAAAGMTGMVVVVSTSNLPPVVAIDSPVEGAVFAAPADVAVQAGASDAGESISDVQFFANDNPVGAASTSPFSITASNLTAGRYSLTAVATDSGGLSKTSAPVNISVVTPVDVTLSSPQVTNGQFQFTYTANPGLNYVVQNSPDLTNWTSLATNTASVSNELYGEAFDVNFLRFYRVGRLPNP